MIRAQKSHIRLRFILTTLCNFSCLGCHQEGVSQNKNQLTIDELIIIQNFITKTIDPSSYSIGLTGGNPSLRTDIVDIVKSFRKNGANKVTITDNGSTIQKYLEDLKDARLDELHISLHSSKPETFTKITHRPAKDLLRIVDTLKSAVEIFGQDKIQLNLTLFRNLNTTVSEIKGLINTAILTDIRKIRIGSLIPNTTDIQNNDIFLKYHISINEFIEYLKELKYSVIPSIDQSLEVFEIEGIRIECQKPALKKFCKTCNLELQKFCSTYGEYCSDIRITPQGLIKPCLFITDHDIQPIKNQGNSKLLKTYVM